jgi:hypothetical protein
MGVNGERRETTVIPGENAAKLPSPFFIFG